MPIAVAPREEEGARRRAPYGVSGLKRVRSVCGTSSGRPKISLEDTWQHRILESTSFDGLEQHGDAHGAHLGGQHWVVPRPARTRRRLRLDLVQPEALESTHLARSSRRSISFSSTARSTIGCHSTIPQGAS